MEHMWWVQYLRSVKRRYLWWVPLVDHCGRYARGDTRLSNIGHENNGPVDETMSNVHTTYPLWVWTRFELAMHGTRSVGGWDINQCRGMFSAGGRSSSLAIPWDARGGLTTPGWPTAGGRTPSPGEQDAVVAIIFVIGASVGYFNDANKSTSACIPS